jgi:hypothetical protein
VAGIGGLAWIALALPQRPSEADAAAAIEKSRAVALEYGRSLPDFVCTETIGRYTDPLHRGGWIPQDTLTVKLTYFGQKEDHKLTLIDGKPTDRTYSSLAGAIGVGEFGGTLESIFLPKSAATFRWEGWRIVRKHRAAVYSYAVEPAHSNYSMVTGSTDHTHMAIVGYHGVLEIDRETGAVLHFTYQADHIARELQVDYARTTVDYDFADVGGKDYLLPASSETEVRSPRQWSRNQITFREYRKFSSDSVISFGGGK